MKNIILKDCKEKIKLIEEKDIINIEYKGDLELEKIIINSNITIKGFSKIEYHKNTYELCILDKNNYILSIIKLSKQYACIKHKEYNTDECKFSYLYINTYDNFSNNSDDENDYPKISYELKNNKLKFYVQFKQDDTEEDKVCIFENVYNTVEGIIEGLKKYSKVFEEEFEYFYDNYENKYIYTNGVLLEPVSKVADSMICNMVNLDQYCPVYLAKLLDSEYTLINKDDLIVYDGELLNNTENYMNFRKTLFYKLTKTFISFNELYNSKKHDYTFINVFEDLKKNFNILLDELLEDSNLCDILKERNVIYIYHGQVYQYNYDRFQNMKQLLINITDLFKEEKEKECSNCQ